MDKGWYHNSPAKVEGYDAGFQQTNLAAYGKGVWISELLMQIFQERKCVFGTRDARWFIRTKIHQYWGYSQLNMSLQSKHNSRDRLRYFTSIHLSDLNEMTENNYGFESMLKRDLEPMIILLVLKLIYTPITLLQICL